MFGGGAVPVAHTYACFCNRVSQVKVKKYPFQISRPAPPLPGRAASTQQRAARTPCRLQRPAPAHRTTERSPHATAQRRKRGLIFQCSDTRVRFLSLQFSLFNVYQIPLHILSSFRSPRCPPASAPRCTRGTFHDVMPCGSMFFVLRWLVYIYYYASVTRARRPRRARAIRRVHTRGTALF